MVLGSEQPSTVYLTFGGLCRERCASYTTFKSVFFLLFPHRTTVTLGCAVSAVKIDVSTQQQTSSAVTEGGLKLLRSHAADPVPVQTWKSPTSIHLSDVQAKVQAYTLVEVFFFFFLNT